MASLSGSDMARLLMVFAIAVNAPATRCEKPMLWSIFPTRVENAVPRFTSDCSTVGIDVSNAFWISGPLLMIAANTRSATSSLPQPSPGEKKSLPQIPLRSPARSAGRSP